MRYLPKGNKELDASGIDYLFHDIRDGSLKPTQVSKWLSAVGGDALVNKRSTTWRGLNDAERQRADSEKQIVGLLIENPTLIKRPVVVTADSVFVGWTSAVKAELGL